MSIPTIARGPIPTTALCTTCNVERPVREVMGGNHMILGTCGHAVPVPERSAAEIVAEAYPASWYATALASGDAQLITLANRLAEQA